MKHLFQLSLILCLLSYGTVVLGQSKLDIEGIVKDSTDQALVAASVVLLNAKDSVLVAFSLTNDDGKFLLRDVNPGEFALQITYVGYGTFSRLIQVDEGEKNKNLGIISLSSNINKLSEVVVRADFIPIVIKKDTVEYTADAFKVKPNASVEDLLKKMPGIEVDDDGSITAQGEDVKTVTVDGKKFFGDDPKMATQNLPADAIKKVQVFDKKSEKAEFTGIDDGDTEKTINLELKEDKKIGLFGDVKGGLGADDDFETARFDSRININKFSDKYQFSTIANFNNLNQQGFSYSDYYSLTGSRGSGGLLNNGASPGISKSLTGGLNFSYTFSPKYEITSSYFVGGVDNNVVSNSSSENFTNESSFLQFDGNDGSSNNISHTVNFELEAKPDSVNRIQFETSIKYNDASLNQLETSEIRGSGDLLQSFVDQERIGDNNSLDLDLSLNYGRRLGKAGRTINLSTDLGKLNEADDLFLDQNNLDYDDFGIPETTESIIQDQISTRDNNSYDVRLSYTEPLMDKLYLDLELRRNNVNNESIKDFFDLDPLDQNIKTLNDALSTAFNNEYSYNYIGTSLQKNTENLKTTLTLDYKNAVINGQLLDAGTSVNNSFNYLLPKLILNFDKKRLRIQYSTRVTEPSVNQLSPILDNSNPNNIYLGNADLNPEYTHRLNFRYFFFDSFTFRNLFASLNTSYTLNDIVNAITFDEHNARVSRPLNVDNNKNISTSLSYSSPIRPLHIKTRLRGSLGWTDGITFLNDIENNVITSNQSFRATFENIDNEVVSIQFSGNWRWNQTSYDQSEIRNQNFLTQSYKADILVELGKGWTWDNEISQTIFSEETYGDNNKFTLWNMGLNKNLYNDRLSLKLSAFDLLNQNQGISRTNTTTSISETISNTLSRYFMLTANYKLSSFSGKRRMHFFHG